MSAPRVRLQSRHWLGKTMAGLLLGYALSLAFSGLFALLTPGGLGGEGKIQVVMWTIAPAWATVLGFVYLFRDSRSAWLWLGGATALAWALLWLLKVWMGAGLA
jgi:hypothetical protein